MIIYECNEEWRLAVPIVAIVCFFIMMTSLIIVFKNRENDDNKISSSGVFGAFYYFLFSSDLNQFGRKWVIPLRLSVIGFVSIMVLNPC